MESLIDGTNMQYLVKNIWKIYFLCQMILSLPSYLVVRKLWCALSMQTDHKKWWFNIRHKKFGSWMFWFWASLFVHSPLIEPTCQKMLHIRRTWYPFLAHFLAVCLTWFRSSIFKNLWVWNLHLFLVCLFVVRCLLHYVWVGTQSQKIFPCKKWLISRML